eukprot:maker-scaffold330_size203968-snap-gene-0.22 protein:Tk05065 transcript:maker-scaffold330_size203968-snap-gene-0.22-mRNA-1 annotation:"transposable element tcb2 transposase"
MLGVVCSNGVKLPPIWVKGTLKATEYKSILVHKVFPVLDATLGVGNYIWQQDGAPAHTADAVQSYIERRLGSSGFWSKGFWPPSSPNLNPLDYSVWTHVERFPPTQADLDLGQLLKLMKSRYKKSPGLQEDFQWQSEEDTALGRAANITEEDLWRAILGPQEKHPASPSLAFAPGTAFPNLKEPWPKTNIAITTFRPLASSRDNLPAVKPPGNASDPFSLFHDRRELGIPEKNVMEENQEQEEECLCGVDILRPHSLLNHIHEFHTNFTAVAARTQKPWTVVILAQTWNRGLETCDGTLINHHFVLTSTQCLCQAQKQDRVLCSNPGKVAFDIFPTSLRQFDVYIGRSENGVPRKRYSGTQVIVPPGLLNEDFDGQSGGIGLLRVDPFVVFTDNTMPICLDGVLGEIARLQPSHVSLDQPFASVPEQRDHGCTSNDNLPKPFHPCASPCTMAQVPSLSDPLCANFFQELRADYSWDPITSPITTFLVQRPGSEAKVCYPRPDHAQWCRVKHVDSALDYSGGSDWGFCTPNCGLGDPDGTTTPQAGTHGVTLGRLTEGDFGSCSAFPSGGPALQWTKISGESLQIRAVQVGVTSRGLGCCSAHSPSIFSKVGAKRDWILKQAQAGGCPKYV